MYEVFYFNNKCQKTKRISLCTKKRIYSLKSLYDRRCIILSLVVPTEASIVDILSFFYLSIIQFQKQIQLFLESLGGTEYGTVVLFSANLQWSDYITCMHIVTLVQPLQFSKGAALPRTLCERGMPCAPGSLFFLYRYTSATSVAFLE